MYVGIILVIAGFMIHPTAWVDTTTYVRSLDAATLGMFLLYVGGTIWVLGVFCWVLRGAPSPIVVEVKEDDRSRNL